ncbi:putative glycosylphosphatidylinositol anchoring protein [Hamiltosporidium tvaerminnensis]|uniref:GPI-anchored wall transfer protein 1 n=1 Tax=Hamiltosporidium tvaerminnensis TaxID=1176355 RepID=A0A4Q9LW40_9MICR|nr:Glucosaminyl phosphatidylinositol (GlcN-PI) nositol acylation protein [Hamiltosporidium tvaerminnensis]TBU04558.1 putative glycosylphosphatidylinositol anchoring protein [Hamiltosporidium tvaerminnensis]TBU12854.1 putative glycosylphosphatidylinositol anchoring protein [Hamiltosporidium tvaerminnensis]
MDRSTETELFLVTSISYTSMLAYKCMNIQNSLALELIFWILPQYIAICYPDWIVYLYIMLICIIFLKRKNLFVKYKEEPIKNYYPILDSYRAYLMLMVVISIFAVDFNFYPERFKKSSFFGLTLMDVGIGSFLFNSGAMSVKMSRIKLIFNSLIMIGLGFVRLFTILYFNYTVDITEYGYHMNFYFILGAVYLIYGIIRSKYNFKIALLLTVIYEYFLRVKNQDVFIFSEYRNSLFLKNKEGIYSILPSLTIFMFSSEFGNIGFSKDSNKEKYMKILGMSCMFLFIYYISNGYMIASRRLGNLTYVSWIVGLHSLHLFLSLTVTAFVSFKPLRLHVWVSKNMLTLFLFSNILVLIGNLLFDWKKINEMLGNIVNISYIFISIIIPYIFTKNK